MNFTYIKLFVGTVLFGTLVALTVFNVPHDDRLIDLIYAALLGLGITHLATPSATPAPAPAEKGKEGGSAHVGLLALIGLSSILLLAGCSMPTATPSTPQDTQLTYTQACAAYGAAFATALELRAAGKLDLVQVQQVSLIDSQITPLCTGPLPADATAATQQVTAALTALAILEALNKEKQQ